MNTLSTFFSTYSKETVSLFVPLLTVILSRIFQNRPRLAQSVRHVFTFLIQEPLMDAHGKVLSPTQTVNTASVSVLNSGRVTATEVEITFNWKPQYFNVWPSRSYAEKLAPDGRFSVLLDNLAPREVFGFELLAINRQLPEMVNVRSATAMSVKTPLHLQPVVSRWVLGLVWAMVFMGFATSIYLVTLVIQIVAKPS
jgi:hypothetical protein